MKSQNKRKSCHNGRISHREKGNLSRQIISSSFLERSSIFKQPIPSLVRTPGFFFLILSFSFNKDPKESKIKLSSGDLIFDDLYYRLLALVTLSNWQLICIVQSEIKHRFFAKFTHFLWHFVRERPSYITAFLCLK